MDNFKVTDQLAVVDTRRYVDGEAKLLAARIVRAAEHQDYIATRAIALVSEDTKVGARLQFRRSRASGHAPSGLEPGTRGATGRSSIAARATSGSTDKPADALGVRDAEDVHRIIDPLPPGRQPHVKTLPTPEAIAGLYGELTENSMPGPPSTYPGQWRAYSRMEQELDIGLPASSGGLLSKSGIPTGRKTTYTSPSGRKDRTRHLSHSRPQPRRPPLFPYLHRNPAWRSPSAPTSALPPSSPQRRAVFSPSSVLLVRVFSSASSNWKNWCSARDRPMNIHSSSDLSRRQAIDAELLGVDDFAIAPRSTVPAWLSRLSVPPEWRTGHLEGGGIEPCRITVCGRRTDGGWDGCETLSVFTFSGTPTADHLEAGHCRGALAQLGVDLVAAVSLVVPSRAGVSAVRCSGQGNVGGRAVWTQSHSLRRWLHSARERLSRSTIYLRGCEPVGRLGT